MISHVLGLTRSDFQIFAATRSSSKAVWFPVGIRMFDVLFSLYHYDFFQFFSNLEWWSIQEFFETKKSQQKLWVEKKIHNSRWSTNALKGYAHKTTRHSDGYAIDGSLPTALAKFWAGKLIKFFDQIIAR